jgi:hypothetical protein
MKERTEDEDTGCRHQMTERHAFVTNTDLHHEQRHRHRCCEQSRPVISFLSPSSVVVVLFALCFPSALPFLPVPLIRWIASRLNVDQIISMHVVSDLIFCVRIVNAETS